MNKKIIAVLIALIFIMEIAAIASCQNSIQQIFLEKNKEYSKNLKSVEEDENGLYIGAVNMIKLPFKEDSMIYWQDVPVGSSGGITLSKNFDIASFSCVSDNKKLMIDSDLFIVPAFETTFSYQNKEMKRIFFMSSESEIYYRGYMIKLKERIMGNAYYENNVFSMDESDFYFKDKNGDVYSIKGDISLSGDNAEFSGKVKSENAQVFETKDTAARFFELFDNYFVVFLGDKIIMNGIDISSRIRIIDFKKITEESKMSSVFDRGAKEVNINPGNTSYLWYSFGEGAVRMFKSEKDYITTG